MCLLACALAAGPARAHFIWIVPDGPEGTKAKVVFSDNLEPDADVPLANIVLRTAAAPSKKVPAADAAKADRLDTFVP
jgi:hypothetical protein